MKPSSWSREPGFDLLFVALLLQLRTLAGRIGLALLLVSAAGLTLAAIITTDPITISKDAMTIEGSLHNLGGTLGIAMPLASALIGWNLAHNSAWSSAERPLLRATGLALVAFVMSFAFAREGARHACSTRRERTSS
jgi:hypothetical protein